MNRSVALTLVLLFVSANIAYAETYKWKDKSGATHYSDVPPSTGPYETLGTKKISGTAPAVNADTPSVKPSAAKESNSKNAQSDAEPDQSPIARAKAADEKRKQQKAKEEEQKQKEEKCDVARSNIEKLKTQETYLKANDLGGNLAAEIENVGKEIKVSQEYLDKECK